MARIKSTIKSLKHFEELVDDVAKNQIELERLLAEQEDELQKVRDEYESMISTTKNAIKSDFALAQSYAEHHREELLPGGKKTSATAQARFGFRLSPGTLKQLNRQWTVAKSIEALEDSDRFNLITVKKSLNKDEIKEQIKDDEELAKFGLRLDAPDEFWIEAKRDETAEKRLK
jgi:phage host-nuclease inhibitor protein Gam